MAIVLSHGFLLLEGRGAEGNVVLLLISCDIGLWRE